MGRWENTHVPNAFGVSTTSRGHGNAKDWRMLDKGDVGVVGEHHTIPVGVNSYRKRHKFVASASLIDIVRELDDYAP